MEFQSSFSVFTACDLTALKNVESSTLAFEVICSDAKSDVDAAETVARGRRCKVSGTNRIIKVPRSMMTGPSRKGSHGDLAMSADATDGPISSARRPEHVPRRKILDLCVSGKSAREVFWNSAYLFSSVVISLIVA